jgi:hypothetical protein
MAGSPKLEELLVKGRQSFGELLGYRPGAKVSANPKEDGTWLVNIECLEREGIPNTMDIIGLYEVVLDHQGQILGYTRTKMRKRGDCSE